MKNNLEEHFNSTTNELSNCPKTKLEYFNFKLGTFNTDSLNSNFTEFTNVILPQEEQILLNLGMHTGFFWHCDDWSLQGCVNIQHIESLNNTVKNITGIEVKERIPDSVLALADEVVNIDLTADELISRLKEGKIYAYEPQLKMFELLKQNINENKLQDKVIIYNKGVFCYEGKGVMNNIDIF
jgi:hypothetical protein